MKKYDVAIIGAGTSGLSARREVEKVTDNYVVVDGGTLGTTCARVGCMPSKVLIQVAHDFHRREVLAQEGIHGGEKLTVDQQGVMKHVRALRDRFVRGVMSGFEEWKESHFIGKYAQFIDRNTLDLGDEKIQADKIIIATGSKPIFPEAWKPFSSYFMDTDVFFEQETLPEKIAVLGLGVIGIELGQSLHRLGFNVTGVGRRDGIGGLSDPVVKEYARNKFAEEMNISFGGVQSLGEADGQIILKMESHEVRADKVLLAMGRRPNLKNLGLENLDINVNNSGVPDYNRKTFQVGDLPIFIAGDVTGENGILHEAADEGRIAGFNAVHSPEQFTTRTPLAITFSAPNICVAGLSYDDVTAREGEFAVGEVSFEGQGRSIVMLEEIGHLRVYGCKETGALLGAEMFAPHGEHLAHLVAWAVAMKLTVTQTLALPFYHPVVEEGLRTALRDLDSKLNNPKKGPLEISNL